MLLENHQEVGFIPEKRVVELPGKGVQLGCRGVKHSLRILRQVQVGADTGPLVEISKALFQLIRVPNPVQVVRIPAHVHEGTAVQPLPANGGGLDFGGASTGGCFSRNGAA